MLSVAKHLAKSLVDFQCEILCFAQDDINEE